MANLNAVALAHLPEARIQRYRIRVRKYGATCVSCGRAGTLYRYAWVRDDRMAPLSESSFEDEPFCNLTCRAAWV